jgi:amidase
MNRRNFLQLTATASAGFIGCKSVPQNEPRRQVRSPSYPFQWEEATIPELQRAMHARRASSVSLVRAYLARIRQIDRHGPAINSLIEINPDALEIARALDKERVEKGSRGPLHGIPVLLKDNINTADRMMTTAGSLALLGSIAPRDSFLVERLRAAGAVILGKTNLSEWANFRSNRSTSGWSGRGGLTRNPYVLDRNTSGSSSGSGAAVAANLCAVAIGTETDGSIISPSTYCGIVGLKPTVGLVSRSGIIPISTSQDTAGPMTRTVMDAAILLAGMTGVDAADPASAGSRGKFRQDYASLFDSDGLRGSRLGVARHFFHSRNSEVNKILEAVLGTIKTCGAELVDPVEMKSFEKIGDAEYQVMLYEFKDGLNKYFACLGSNAPVKSLKELIDFNIAHQAEEMPYFGQETFLEAEKKGPLTDREYLEAVEKCRRLSREEGIDAVMNEHRLDAIIAPSGGPAHSTDLVYGNRDTGGSSSPAAIAGYPSITVPAGMAHGLPFGLSFFGHAYSEALLLKLAYAFEQATRARRPPEFLRTTG